MANIKYQQTFRYEGHVYEKLGMGSYRKLSPCLENYTVVTDVGLILALDQHTANFDG